MQPALEVVEQCRLRGGNKLLEHRPRILGVINSDVVIPIAAVGADYFTAVEKSETPSMIFGRDVVQKRLARGGDNSPVRLKDTLLCQKRDPAIDRLINVPLPFGAAQQLDSVLGALA